MKCGSASLDEPVVVAIEEAVERTKVYEQAIFHFTSFTVPKLLSDLLKYDNWQCNHEYDNPRQSWILNSFYELNDNGEAQYLLCNIFLSVLL